MVGREAYAIIVPEGLAARRDPIRPVPGNLLLCDHASRNCIVLAVKLNESGSYANSAEATVMSSAAGVKPRDERSVTADLAICSDPLIVASCGLRSASGLRQIIRLVDKISCCWFVSDQPRIRPTGIEAAEDCDVHGRDAAADFTFGGYALLDLLVHLHGDQRYNGKTLAERLSGRFYTPAHLAGDLAEQMVSALDLGSLKKVYATDPFCGDGRLVIALLVAAAERPELARLPWVIELRDREAAVVREAAERVNAAAKNLGIRIKTSVIVGDTFESDLSARFDLVITNPPWELLKPDSRELKHLSSIGASRYKENLRATSRRLDDRFPDARAENAWGGWGTNLARCGWDLCLSIAQKGGIIGIILPATIMGDQSSTPMRRKAFGMNTLMDAAVYPSEARLFDRVDQPVVALTMRVGGCASGAGRIRSFDADRLPSGGQALVLNKTAMEARGWTLPVGRPSGADELMPKFGGLPTLQSWEGEGASDLWLGRELDETRIVEKVTKGTKHPFIKGRMIARHGVVENPAMSVRPSFCAGFHSASKPRAVWRDVARATSKRRMIGTVIPAGWVAGNSLHVACYRDGDVDRTAALHALLSSFVVEAQVRARLTTGHMSLGVVRRARMPVLDSRLIKHLSSLAHIVMNGRDMATECRLEIAVAKAYGLDRDEMARLLDDFPKLEETERQALTSVAAWNK